jgi:hypothetical protein
MQRVAPHYLGTALCHTNTSGLELGLGLEDKLGLGSSKSWGCIATVYN